MTASTKQRPVARLGQPYAAQSFSVASTTGSAGNIYQGTMVMLPVASGSVQVAEKYSIAAKGFCVVAGVADEDRLAGDTRELTTRIGVFRFVNGDSFTDADIGKTAWALDNQTVVKRATAGSNTPLAGTVRDVDALGVWTQIYDVGTMNALLSGSSK